MEKRSVGFFLALGILIMPPIFSWVTLRQGYSTLSRVLAFGYLIFLSVSIYESGQQYEEKAKIEMQRVTELETQANSGDVNSMLELAKKFNSDTSGNKIENLEKTESYLTKAALLGNNEAKQMLMDVEKRRLEQKQQIEMDKAKAELEQINQENNVKVATFLEGEWVAEAPGYIYAYDNKGKITHSPGRIINGQEDRTRGELDLMLSKCKSTHGFVSDGLERYKDFFNQLSSDGFSSSIYVFEECPEFEEGLYFFYISSSDSNNETKGNNLLCFECKDHKCFRTNESQFFDQHRKQYRPIPIKKYPTIKDSTDHSVEFQKVLPTLKYSNLPFTGKREFNFYGGSGTGQTISIEKNGLTVVEFHGTTNSEIIYKGQFSNPIKDKDGSEYTIEGDKIYLIKAGEIERGCMQEGVICESVLTPLDNEIKKEVQKSGDSNSTAALIKEMIASSLDFEKRENAQKKIEALPKPKRGNKKDARKLNDQSLALAKQLNYQEALPLMESAYQLDSADVEIVNNLAYLQIMSSKLADAKKSLFETLALKPDRNAAWADLGKVFAIEGDEESAKNCYINYYMYSKNEATATKFLETEDAANPVITRVKKAADEAIISLGMGD